MEFYVPTLVFLFGAIIGSFLNVVAYRYNTGKSLTGRSHCTSCGTTLKVYDLVPIFSFISQRGRCRHCGARISSRYFFVECLTGILFLGVYFHTPFELVSIGISLVVVSLLVVILVYDMRHMIIPRAFVWALLCASILYVIWEPYTQTFIVPHISMVLGGIIPSFLYATLWFISKGRWIGLGDAQLAFPLGLMLGAWGSISFFILSFWIGAVVMVGVLIVGKMLQTYRGQLSLSFRGRALTMKSEVPFAPFLVAAFFAVHFLQLDVLLLVGNIAIIAS